MNDYEAAKAFWNSVLASDTPQAVTGRAFTDETFARLTAEGLVGAENVLDYGCGSGWGLFELFFTRRFTHGLGVDASENGVRFANQCAALSGLSDTLQFIQGDEALLEADAYDFILTVNLLDVIPAEACEQILQGLHRALKKGRSMLVCLNPEFTEDELINLIGMEKRGDYYYKNGILRARSMTTAKWRELFERLFTVEEIAHFALEEREQAHPRIAYLLRKR